MKVEDDNFGSISTEYVQSIKRFVRSKRRHVPFRLEERQRLLVHRMEHDKRAILFEWMAEVCLEFSASPTTFLVACDIVERASQVLHLTKENMQITGCAGIFIAFKLEETKFMQASTLTFLAAKTFTREELLKTEAEVLEAIRFDPWKMVSSHLYTSHYRTGSVDWLASMILMLVYPHLPAQDLRVEPLARIALRIAQLSSGKPPSFRRTRTIFTLQRRVCAILAKLDTANPVVKLMLEVYAPDSREPIENLLQFALEDSRQ